jgi:hypothetical protein
MIDGSDKLLMEHRNRQVDWAAKRIAELEAEIAALRTGGTQPASTNISRDAIARLKYMNQCIQLDGFVKIERHTGWAHSVEQLAQQHPC